MGHLVGKDIYQKLGSKIDGLTMRTPQNDKFYAILKELYTEEEANLVVRMPYSLSSFNKVQRVTGIEKTKLQHLLASACAKGLIADIKIKNKYLYIISPLIVGIFEYTMMRVGKDTNSKKWARLFDEYMQMPDGLYKANYGNGEQISIMRAMPHEGAMLPQDYVEVLDYEKALSVVEKSNKYAIGICSCRHEKHHLGTKECDVPLETCSSFGLAADYLIRNNLAKEVSEKEMIENLAISQEKGLVLNADNVQNNVSFICQCCDDCCNLLAGISKHGYSNSVVTSNYIAELIDTDDAKCTGCTKCETACPINAIEMIEDTNPETRRKKIPKVDTSICIGCGVCGLACKTKAIRLVKREQRVIHPETTYERVLLQSLERGTIQNFIFDNPQSNTHAFMRGVIGGFLKLSPVKKALMSHALNSDFLTRLAAKK